MRKCRFSNPSDTHFSVLPQFWPVFLYSMFLAGFLAADYNNLMFLVYRGNTNIALNDTFRFFILADSLSVILDFTGLPLEPVRSSLSSSHSLIFAACFFDLAKLFLLFAYHFRFYQRVILGPVFGYHCCNSLLHFRHFSLEFSLGAAPLFCRVAWQLATVNGKHLFANQFLLITNQEDFKKKMAILLIPRDIKSAIVVKCGLLLADKRHKYTRSLGCSVRLRDLR